MSSKTYKARIEREQRAHKEHAKLLKFRNACTKKEDARQKKADEENAQRMEKIKR